MHNAKHANQKESLVNTRGPNDLEEREPRLLKCGHTFCFECINKLYDDTNKNIKCPTDRTITEY